ncbi:ADL112Wp [Eremothecium gossypii ATCC 10895]|uniref:ADL112Wp n=1 Tax=Eremothecium gossypii (strain ATCC 10895 / CBS 109.51 / FGSC 9923 / NRRL Y-1056) TaxID=284811 RepID=Q75AN4_EREGS|nr:ADL112Wp [Eremothecium gossypii ATCC 10895]AAS51808.1 ADL112Wp [Eremothecium gossypii ATCC 10895]AEY96106.1 FADL112Wp [Eremothecium gossypii FDAG1]
MCACCARVPCPAQEPARTKLCQHIASPPRHGPGPRATATAAGAPQRRARTHLRAARRCSRAGARPPVPGCRVLAHPPPAHRRRRPRSSRAARCAAPHGPARARPARARCLQPRLGHARPPRPARDCRLRSRPRLGPRRHSPLRAARLRRPRRRGRPGLRGRTPLPRRPAPPPPYIADL